MEKKIVPLPVWILGAPDPEMEAIEKLLRQCRQSVTYATVTDRRVFAGNAYKADGTTLGENLPLQCWNIWVECGFPGQKPEYLVDHHNLGDPGYGKSPSHFWLASSIGQVHQLLRKMAYGVDISKPTREEILTAAADHCLARAYKGECPTIYPDELLRFRTKECARFQGKKEEEIAFAIERAREVIKTRAVETSYGRLADFGDETMPELLEASAVEGIAFLGIGLPQRDGRRKKVLMGGSSEMIRWWMATCELADMYGDPERGFAGGYLP